METATAETKAKAHRQHHLATNVNADIQKVCEWLAKVSPIKELNRTMHLTLPSNELPPPMSTTQVDEVVKFCLEATKSPLSVELMYPITLCQRKVSISDLEPVNRPEGSIEYFLARIGRTWKVLVVDRKGKFFVTLTSMKV